jgi:uncharacterized OB-fold protein
VTVLVPQAPGIPTGAHSAAAEPYWEGCLRGELLYQRCAECREVNMKPASSCGMCGAAALAWERSNGRGRLYSWTVVWRPQHPTFQVPYAPAIIELDEGFWLMSAIVGCDHEDLRADMPVVVEFHPANDDVTLPYFRPA